MANCILIVILWLWVTCPLNCVFTDKPSFHLFFCGVFFLIFKWLGCKWGIRFGISNCHQIHPFPPRTHRTSEGTHSLFPPKMPCYTLVSPTPHSFGIPPLAVSGHWAGIMGYQPFVWATPLYCLKQDIPQPHLQYCWKEPSTDGMLVPSRKRTDRTETS